MELEVDFLAGVNVLIDCYVASCSEPVKSNVAIIVPVVVVLIIVIAFAVVATVYLRKQLAHTEERKLKLRAQLSGLALPEPEVTHACTHYVTYQLSVQL